MADFWKGKLSEYHLKQKWWYNSQVCLDFLKIVNLFGNV